jgi:hypothetical protein
MTNRVCRRLRKLLNLPRVPKTMGTVDRLAYRNLKARFKRLPAPARAIFLANLKTLQA